MVINGKNYLPMRRRGCNYTDAEFLARADVGNYRVFVRFTDKNGVEVCGDFGRTYAYDLSKEKPRIVADNVLYSDLQYTDERGTWAYRPRVDAKAYTYNVADILRYINALSAEHYDAIKWVEEFEIVHPAGENFTPSSLIYQWAKAHKLPTGNTLDGIRVKLYTGEYKYMAYHVQPQADGNEKITVVLEEG